MGQCMSTEDSNPYKKDYGAIPKKQQENHHHHHTRANTGSLQKKAKAHDNPETEGQTLHQAVVDGLAGKYKVLKLLGSGAEGNTYLVIDEADGKQWALKLIKLPLPTRFVQAIYREIKLQAELGEGHRNIITVEEVVLTSHYLGLVMEYAAGGALTSFLSKKFKMGTKKGLLMQEDEARYLFRQIVNAVDYCHRHKVVHRDLKLDNTLLTGDEPPVIKLCDFGFAKGWGESSHFTTVIGTPDYMSPQLTASKSKGSKEKGPTPYDGTKADVWAMGVLLCVMMTGKFPFEGDSVSDMNADEISKASHGVLMLRSIWKQQNRGAWNSVEGIKDFMPYLSTQIKDLLDKIFELDEQSRINVAGIKEHPWMKLPMQPQHENAIVAMERLQIISDQKYSAGAFHSKRRDQAISELIKLATSEEFKTRASEPITAQTTFQTWARIGLKTIRQSYHIMDKRTLQELIAESDKLSTRFALSRSHMETNVTTTCKAPRGPQSAEVNASPIDPHDPPHPSDPPPIPKPSNLPAKATSRPRPDLGFHSLMHGSGGERARGAMLLSAASVDTVKASSTECGGVNLRSSVNFSGATSEPLG